MTHSIYLSLPARGSLPDVHATNVAAAWQSELAASYGAQSNTEKVNENPFIASLSNTVEETMIVSDEAIKRILRPNEIDLFCCFIFVSLFF